jgi:pimeloyl-ACP methyl ester carboxylesterase
VVEEVEAPSVALVGHSMGGDAAVFAARQLGERVAGVVWVDVFRSLGNEPVSSAEEIEAFVAPFQDDFGAAVDQFVRNMFHAGADPELVDRIATDMATAPHEAALRSLGYALNREPPIIEALSAITAPVVAINPDIAPTDADSLRRHGVEPIVLEGVGHFSMLEDPEQFNATLASTLASFAL